MSSSSRSWQPAAQACSPYTPWAPTAPPCSWSLPGTIPVGGTPTAPKISRRAGAVRITDWLPAWLSESEGSHPAGPRPRGRLLTCIGFSSAKGLKFVQLAGLQALKAYLPRSQHTVDLGKCGAKGTRTPGLLHAMQVGQLACPGHWWHRPAESVRSCACECLLVCGRWLSRVLDHLCVPTLERTGGKQRLPRSSPSEYPAAVRLACLRLVSWPSAARPRPAPALSGPARPARPATPHRWSPA